MAKILALLATFSLLALPSLAGAQDRSGIEFFEKKIRPVLAEHCYQCHSEAAKKNKGGLRLDSREGLLKGGDSGPALVPGKANDSLIVKALHYQGDLQMPPKGKLPQAVLADFSKWVDLGAPDPRDGKTQSAVQVDLEKGKRHWAFRPLGQAAAPPVKDRAWVRSPLDAFILYRLEEKGMRPAPETEPLTWLRRVHLDLIGLPPTPEEQRAFLKGLSPQSYERVALDLLGRPQYGERWGRHWLDVARYGESCGYEGDGAKANAWRYRDWVIEALNRDLPYDRFLTEQIAGDELPDADARTQVATAFLNVGPFDTIAADSKQARYDALDDVLGTTTSAFLGLTLQCARCHDHKFEPLSQRDYYRVLAAFDTMKLNGQVQLGTPHELERFRQASDKIDAELTVLLAELAKVAVPLLERAAAQKKAKLGNLAQTMRNASPKTGKDKADAVIRERAKVEEAVRETASPEQMRHLKEIYEQAIKINDRRPELLLAPAYSEVRKATGKTNLLIRGEANRPGPEVEFGLPALFDSGEVPPKGPGRRLWLARWMTGKGQALTARVMANRLWQYHFGRGFLEDASDLGLGGGAPAHPELLEWLAQDLVRGGWKLKRVHREIVLSSTYRQSAAHPQAALDPDNRLFARWPVHRLEAEAIRDALLAVGGKLSKEMGGPSIKGAENQRRSVYLTVKRNTPVPELSLLGFPDPAVSCARRSVSTTPVQSLLLLNGKLANGQAGAFAERLRREAGNDPAGQVRLAYELALGRPPRPQELQNALAFLQAPAAGSTQESLTAFCLVLFNANEFVYAN